MRGPVPVQSPTVRGEEDRSFGALADARSIARTVRGASGMVTTLPPLRAMTRCGARVPGRCVRRPCRRLGYPQPVEREQGDQ